MSSLFNIFKKSKSVQFAEEPYKLWCKYFAPTQIIRLTNTQKMPRLLDQTSKFTIKTMKPADLLPYVQDKEFNPKEKLPIIFDFQQPLPECYPLICIEIEKNKACYSNHIISEIFPHLMQYSIIFFYQLSSNIPEMMNGKNIPHFHPTILGSFTTVLSVLLQNPTDDTNDFFTLFETLEPEYSAFPELIVLNSNELFITFFWKVISIICKYILEKPNDPKINLSFFISFCCKFFSLLVTSSFNEFMIPYLEEFLNVLLNKINYTSFENKPKIGGILALMIHTLFFSNKYQSCAKIPELCIQIITKITKTYTLTNEFFDKLESPFKDASMTFLANSIYLLAKRFLSSKISDISIAKIESPTSKINKDYSLYNGPFLEENQICPKSSKEYHSKQAQIIPKLIEQDSNISGYFVALHNLFLYDQNSISRVILEHALLDLDKNKDNIDQIKIPLQYLTLFFLSISSQKLSSDIMVSEGRNYWNLIINQSSFLPIILNGNLNDFLMVSSEAFISSSISSLSSKPDLILDCFTPLIGSPVTKTVLSLLYYYIKGFPKSIIHAMEGIKLFETLIDFDSRVRETLIQSRKPLTDPDRTELIEMRTLFYNILYIVVNSLNGIQLVTRVPNGLDYMFSLIFEPISYDLFVFYFTNVFGSGNLDIISSVISKLNDFLISTITLQKNPENSYQHEKWKQCVLDLSFILQDSDVSVISSCLISSSFLQTFNKIATHSISDMISNQQKLLPSSDEVITSFTNEQFKFSLTLFKVLTNLCIKSLDLTDELNNPSWMFELWTKFFLCNVERINEFIDPLLNFAFLEDTSLENPGNFRFIRNIQGTKLLLNVSLHSSISNQVVLLLQKYCLILKANHYQLLKAGAIDLLIQHIMTLDKFHDSSLYLALIRLIGSSGFGTSDLSTFLHQIKNAKDMKLKCTLLDCMKDIINSSENETIPYFHFDYRDSIFRLSNVKFPKRFSISMNITLHSPVLTCTQPMNLFTIYSERNNKKNKSSRMQVQLIINKQLDLYFGATGQQMEKLGTLMFNENINILISFNLKKNVLLFINGNLQGVFVIQDKIHFDSSLVFEISKIYADIDNICFYDVCFGQNDINSIETHLVATYSAKVLNKGICVNMGASSEVSLPNQRLQNLESVLVNQINQNYFGSAIFKGYSLSYFPQFIYSVSNSGGVVIFLPLFSSLIEISDPTESAQLFLKLLEIVLALVRQSNQLFLETTFFRFIAHVLRSINPKSLNSDIFKVFFEIYQALQFDELRKEIMMNIWSQISFWKCLPSDLPYYIITQILPCVFMNNRTLFVQCTSFRILLQAFTTYFTQLFQNDPSKISLSLDEKNLANACWQFLDAFAVEQFEESDASTLLMNSLELIVIDCSMFSLDLISKLLERKNSNLLKILQQYDYYNLFFILLSSNEDEIQYKSIRILYQLSSIVDNDFGSSILKAIKHAKLSTSPKIFHLIQDIIFGIIPLFDLPLPLQEAGGSVKKSVLNDAENLSFTIMNPEFFPLMIHEIQLQKDENLNNQFKEIILTNINHKESAEYLHKCHNWPIWISMLFEGDLKKTIGVLTKFVNIQPDLIDDIIEFLYIMQILYNWDNSVFDEFFNQIDNYKNMQIISAIVQYLFINSRIIYEPPSQPFSTNFNIISKQILSLQPPSFKCTFVIRNAENSAWQNASMAEKILDIIISDDQFFKSNIILSKVSSKVDNLQVSLSMIATIILEFLSIKTQSSIDIEDYINRFIQSLQADIKYIDKNQCKGIISSLYSITTITEKQKSDLIEIFKKLDSMINQSNISNISMKIQSHNLELFNTFNSLIPTYQQNKTDSLSMFQQSLKDLFQGYNSNIDYSSFQTNLEIHKNERKILTSLDQRLIRQNQRIFEHISLDLGSNGGTWHSDSTNIHWKMDPEIDEIGRKMFMRPNHHFNPHIDAQYKNIIGNKSENVVEKSEGSFEKFVVSRLDSSNNSGSSKDRYFSLMECQLVSIVAYYRGTVYFTSSGLTFEANETVDYTGVTKTKTSGLQKIVEISDNTIGLVLMRRHLHTDIGLEIFTSSRRSYFFIFKSTEERNLFISILQHMKPPNLNIQKSSPAKAFADSGIQKKWMNGQISNYEYLYWVNMYAGRSFNDISQYPVFPWILQDYESASLDLSDPKSYRDFSKPIAALNQIRLKELKNIYEEISDMPNASLYRSHYSNGAYVIHYLMRNEPFTTLHIELQSGHFDNPERLFKSIPLMWESVSGTNSEFRELIPEFFSTPEFLMNSEHYPINSQDDVGLPKWAKSPQEFIMIHRLALESAFVSSNLNKWIDLIFGYLQQSLEADNLFPHFSMSSSLNGLTDQNDILFIQTQAVNFGITPEKLFSSPHPIRGYIPYDLHPLSDAPFGNFEITQFQKLNVDSPILISSINSSTIHVLSSQGFTVFSVNLDKLQSHEMCKVKMNYPPDQSTAEIIFRHCKFINGNLAVSSPWTSAFTLFNTNGNTSKATVLYKSNDHTAPISALSGDGQFVITAANDNSLFIWDLEKKRLRCSLLAHSAPVTCLDYNAEMDLLVSADSSGKVCFSNAIKKKFIRSFTAIESLFTNVAISTLGFVLLVYQKQELTSILTIVESRDLCGRKLAEIKAAGRCTAFQVIKFPGEIECLLIATDTSDLFVLRPDDLSIMGKAKSPSIIQGATCLKERRTIIYNTCDGLYWSKFE